MPAPDRTCVKMICWPARLSHLSLIHEAPRRRPCSVSGSPLPAILCSLLHVPFQPACSPRRRPHRPTDPQTHGPTDPQIHRLQRFNLWIGDPPRQTTSELASAASLQNTLLRPLRFRTLLAGASDSWIVSRQSVFLSPMPGSLNERNPNTIPSNTIPRSFATARLPFVSFSDFVNPYSIDPTHRLLVPVVRMLSPHSRDTIRIH